MNSHHDKPDRLNQSWSQSAPRYSNTSALSAQINRFSAGPLSMKKGWLGRIACQIAFILFFFNPGLLFLLMGLESGWMPGLLGLFPIGIGLALSWFIWRK
jgi:hypothetical protein